MTIAFDQPDKWYENQNALPLKTAINHAISAFKAYREFPASMDKSGLCIVTEGYRYDEGKISIFLNYDGKVTATANDTLKLTKVR